jgi:hypothetical protein
MYICTYLAQFLKVYFSLQVKNKPHDGVANCTFIFELDPVSNNYYIIFQPIYQLKFIAMAIMVLIAYSKYYNVLLNSCSESTTFILNAHWALQI